MLPSLLGSTVSPTLGLVPGAVKPVVTLVSAWVTVMVKLPLAVLPTLSVAVTVMVLLLSATVVL